MAFYAFGAYSVGWFGSDFFFDAPSLRSPRRRQEIGIHFDFILTLGAAMITSIAGALIGLPTLRLRGDYIAIVTLAFGESLRRRGQRHRIHWAAGRRSPPEHGI